MSPELQEIVSRLQQLGVPGRRTNLVVEVEHKNDDAANEKDGKELMLF